jgi:hypothetical protein
VLFALVVLNQFEVDLARSAVGNHLRVLTQPDLSHGAHVVEGRRHAHHLKAIARHDRRCSRLAKAGDDLAQLLTTRLAMQEVDLIDDHRTHPGQHLRATQLQRVEGLRRSQKAKHPF